MIRILLLALALTATMGQGALAERVALVIGNGAYGELPRLAKPSGDAAAVAEALEGAGFRITRLGDADWEGMETGLAAFLQGIGAGDTVALYYAGHAAALEGEVYLLGTDIPRSAGETVGFLRAEGFSLPDLLAQIAARRPAETLVFLEAGGENPFGSGALGPSRGLGTVDAPPGVFLMTAASAGERALERLSDGDFERNSVFTRALVEALGRPGTPLSRLGPDLRDEVARLAGSAGLAQRPTLVDRTDGTLVLTEGTETAALPDPDPQPDAGRTITPPPQVEIEADFELARSVGTLAAWDAFLSRHQDRRDSFFVTLAEAERDRLLAAEAAAADADARRREIEEKTARRRAEEAAAANAAAEAARRAEAERLAAAERNRNAGANTRMAEVLAFETRDQGVPAQSLLRNFQEHAPTPTQVPGARTMTTAELQALIASGRPYYLFDVLRSGQRLPGAIDMRQLGDGGTFTDQVQQAMVTLMIAEIGRLSTQGMTRFPPMVVYCSGPDCWRSYNAALRLAYINANAPALNLEIYWYRGGVEAWRRAGGQLTGWN